MMQHQVVEIDNVDALQVVFESEAVQVKYVALSTGQEIPWHHHTEVDDLFFVLAGRLNVSTREPLDDVTLSVGETFRVSATSPHRVRNASASGGAAFILIQGVGNVDLIEASENGERNEDRSAGADVEGTAL